MKYGRPTRKTVSVDRGLLVDPVLGDLRNKTITVAATRPGSSYVVYKSLKG